MLIEKVLVVMSCIGDEILGCSGSLLKRKENGDGIFWLTYNFCSMAGNQLSDKNGSKFDNKKST